MRQELADLLIRTITLSCGIERGKDFFKVVLPAIQHSLQTDESRLFLRDRKSKAWKEIARYQEGDRFASGVALSTLAADDAQYTPLAFDTRADDGTIRLFLPLEHEKTPSMLMILSWKKSSPPEWLKDPETLTSFSENLGSFIAWKYMLLEIVLSKRNLESIFDCLPNAVAVIRPDYTLDRINRAFSEQFDIPYHQALGRKCYEVVRDAISPCPECRLEEVFAGGTEVQAEIANGAGMKVRFLPLGSIEGKMRAMEIFQKPSPSAGDAAQVRSAPFLKLYNQLSQPLSVLTLVSEMLIARGSADAEYLEIIRKEIVRVVRILKDEWKLAQDSCDPLPDPLPGAFHEL